MTFWDKLQANVGAWLDGTTVETLQGDSDQADARLRDLNTRETYGPDWQATAERNLEDNRPDVAAQIESEFEAGWDEGRENIYEFGRGVGRVAGDVAGSAAGGVAAGAWEFVKKNYWWILPAGVAAFFWFGGKNLLPRRAAK